jgi:hypothetical protein
MGKDGDTHEQVSSSKVIQIEVWDARNKVGVRSETAKKL